MARIPDSARTLGCVALLSFLACCTAARVEPAVRRAVMDDGTVLAYDVRGGGSPAVVFLHGWACDRTFFEAQADALAADHLVLCVDLRGHGDSGQRGEDYSIARLGKDVADLIEQLDLEQVALVGHSLGGPVGLSAAARLRGRVSLVVGIDCLHDVEQRIPDEAIESMVESLERDLAGAMRAAVESAFSAGADRAVVDRVLERALRTPRATVVGIPRAYSGLDQAALLERARVPVRCLEAAPRGPASPRTRIEENRRHGDFDAAIVEGVGHFLMLEKPDLATERIRRWIDELGSRR
ncbi:MAG: hypothetical protein Fur0037_11370 [Planctomycetota bacterium]